MAMEKIWWEVETIERITTQYRVTWLVQAETEYLARQAFKEGSKVLAHRRLDLHAGTHTETIDLIAPHEGES